MDEPTAKLLPILHVPDPDAERRFYQQLGLRTTYEGPEYPGFIAVGNDSVEFGLSRREDADPTRPGFTWQLGVHEVDAMIATREQAGLNFEVTEERPRADWSYRIVKLRSLNGMEVLLEEQPPPADGPAGAGCRRPQRLPGRCTDPAGLSEQVHDEVLGDLSGDPGTVVVWAVRRGAWGLRPGRPVLPRCGYRPGADS